MNRVHLSEDRVITSGLLCQPILQNMAGHEINYSLISLTIAVRF